MSDQLLTAEQVAERLQVPTSWVREHTRSGAMPHVELGRYRRYELEAVLAWTATLRRGGNRSPVLRRHSPVVAVATEE